MNVHASWAEHWKFNKRRQFPIYFAGISWRRLWEAKLGNCYLYRARIDLFSFNIKRITWKISLYLILREIALDRPLFSNAEDFENPQMSLMTISVLALFIDLKIILHQVYYDYNIFWCPDVLNTCILWHYMH